MSKLFAKNTMHKSPFLPSPFQTFYGGEKVGVNPKVNNMYPGYTAAKYELILVSDCRIRSKFHHYVYIQVCLYYFLHAFYRYIYKVYCFYTVKEDTLIDMVSCMTRNVGLVHQMPFSCDRNGIPAASLEKVSCFELPSN